MQKVITIRWASVFLKPTHVHASKDDHLTIKSNNVHCEASGAVLLGYSIGVFLIVFCKVNDMLDNGV